MTGPQCPPQTRPRTLPTALRSDDTQTTSSSTWVRLHLTTSPSRTPEQPYRKYGTLYDNTRTLQTTAGFPSPPRKHRRRALHITRPTYDCLAELRLVALICCSRTRSRTFGPRTPTVCLPASCPACEIDTATTNLTSQHQSLCSSNSQRPFTSLRSFSCCWAVPS